jgi:phage terminase small subunit
MNQKDEYVLNQMVLFLFLNHVKTNIILAGKGNEKREGMDDTYSQFYTTTRIQALQAAAMYQLSVSMFGNPGGTNWNVGYARLQEWL